MQARPLLIGAEANCKHAWSILPGEVAAAAAVRPEAGPESRVYNPGESLYERRLGFQHPGRFLTATAAIAAAKPMTAIPEGSGTVATAPATDSS